MTKEEIILKYEKEADLLAEKAMRLQWEENNLKEAEICHEKRNQILSCLMDIKQLNETTVKRSELIDFMKWYKQYVPIGTQKSSEEIITDYEKSINSNGA